MIHYSIFRKYGISSSCLFLFHHRLYLIQPHFKKKLNNPFKPCQFLWHPLNLGEEDWGLVFTSPLDATKPYTLVPQYKLKQWNEAGWLSFIAVYHISQLSELCCQWRVSLNCMMVSEEHQRRAWDQGLHPAVIDGLWNGQSQFMDDVLFI